MAGQCCFSGILRKQTSLGLWHERWFRLDGHSIFYCPKPGGHVGKTIMLRDMEIVHSTDKKFAWRLVHKQTKNAIHLAARSNDEKVAWWASIRKAIELTQLPAQGSAAKSPSGDCPGINDFEKLEVVGRGSIGKVFKVSNKHTGEILAMKVIRRDVISRNALEQAVKNEADALYRLHHPFIIRCHEAFQTPKKLCFIMDYHPSSLLEVVTRESYLAEAQAKVFAAEISLALLYLHSMDIIHRDLKLANVLVDAQGHAVVTDFGCAALRTSEAVTFCGSPNTMAPEMVQFQPHSKAVDWWSLGVMLFQMLTGQLPFQGDADQDVFNKIIHDAVVWPQAPELSMAAKGLCEDLLEKDPWKRFQDEDVKAHSFFEGTDWDALENKALPGTQSPLGSRNRSSSLPSLGSQGFSSSRDSSNAISTEGSEGVHSPSEKSSVASSLRASAIRMLRCHSTFNLTPLS